MYPTRGTWATAPGSPPLAPAQVNHEGIFPPSKKVALLPFTLRFSQEKADHRHSGVSGAELVSPSSRNSDWSPAGEYPLHRLGVREVEQPTEKGDKEPHGESLAARLAAGKWVICLYCDLHPECPSHRRVEERGDDAGEFEQGEIDECGHGRMAGVRTGPPVILIRENKN